MPAALLDAPIHVASNSQFEALEEFSSPRTGNASPVDRAAGVIRGVKILGLNSVNPAKRIGITGEAGNHSYSYTLDALEAAVSKYEGVIVRIDHPEFELDKTGRRLPKRGQRKTLDAFGALSNVRVQEDGLYGDLQYNRHHPHAEFVCESAERFPKAIALSHDASIIPQIVNGRCRIVGIEDVRSVDIIGERPGTTFGLFESACVDSSPAHKILATKFRDLKIAAIDVGGWVEVAKICVLESELMATAPAADAADTVADPVAPAAVVPATPEPAAAPVTPVVADGDKPAEPAKPAVPEIPAPVVEPVAEVKAPAEVPAVPAVPAAESAVVETAPVAEAEKPATVEVAESAVGESASWLIANAPTIISQYVPSDMVGPMVQHMLAVCMAATATAASASEVESAASLAGAAANAAASAAADASNAASVASDAASVAATAASEVAATMPAVESAVVDEPAPAAAVVPEPVAPPVAPAAPAVPVAESAVVETPAPAAPAAVAKPDKSAEMEAIEALESADVAVTGERVRLIQKTTDPDVRAELIGSWKVRGRGVHVARSAPPKPPMQALESAAPGGDKSPRVVPLREVLSQFSRN